MFESALLKCYANINSCKNNKLLTLKQFSILSPPLLLLMLRSFVAKQQPSPTLQLRRVMLGQSIQFRSGLCIVTLCVCACVTGRVFERRGGEVIVWGGKFITASCFFGRDRPFFQQTEPLSCPTTQVSLPFPVPSPFYSSALCFHSTSLLSSLKDAHPYPCQYNPFI